MKFASPLLALAFLLGNSSSILAQTEEELARSARDILEAYHGKSPDSEERKVHIICWRTQDRDFAEGYKERVPRMMEHIQAFYAREMERNGFGPLTFNLDYDEDGQLVIHEATGEGNYADYEKPDGQRIKAECWPVLKAAGIDPDLETVLIFTNLSEWDAEAKTFVHKSPYYASGDHRSGLAWQLDSPELDTKNLSLKSPMIQDGEYGRISLGKHNSIFIGGIAHEIGHGFGLPHGRAREDEARAHGTALMGAGNQTYADEVRGEGKGSFITLAHAMRLASHPQFSGSTKGMNLPTKAEFSDLEVVDQSTSFTIRGQVESNLPVYAVVAYMDPSGGSDYDAPTMVAVPDAEGKFSIDCEALVPGKTAELRLIACIVNGATSTWQSGYRVAEDSQIDISAMQVSLELSDFLAALEQRDFAAAQSLQKALPADSQSHRFASSVLNGVRGTRQTFSALRIPAENDSYPLSRIKPVEATVGWQRPAYDHVPRADALLISGSELFETGIYAHAPARHVYDLSIGIWKTLEGKCGLPNQRFGSVVFVIRTDGKEVYRSPETEPGTVHPYKIDLTGVTMLELVTEDAGDGKAVDWGLWLGAELLR